MPAGAARPNAGEASSRQKPSDVTPAWSRLLLAELIDYAGLFPPAALSMRDVVDNYAAYQASPDAWMLGRLVVPVSRLEECRIARAERDDATPATWRVSALATDIDADRVVLESWPYPELRVDSIELKAGTIAEVAHAAAAFDDRLNVFIEVPVGEDPSLLLDAIARHGASAKIRTGGITADAFPSSSSVARFMSRCAERDLAFKATAGLHHPLRGSYPLTYAPDAARGTMFGFLNVFAAAVAADRGATEQDLVEILETTDANALTFASSDIGDVRDRFALSFGSCSFREPIDDLHTLGLL
jgi:hypothetical protein